MDLYLIGHDHKYAAEQMLLTLFPSQRPVYPSGAPAGDRAELALDGGQAVCTLVRDGVPYVGRADVRAWAVQREMP